MTTTLEEPFKNLTNWTTIAGTPTITTGRNGQGVQFALAGAIAYTIPAVQESAVMTVGAAFRTTVLASTRVFEFRSDTGATQHTAFVLNNDGSISAVRSTSVQLAQSAVGLIAANTWYYLEAQFKLGDSPNGTAQLRINGTSIINVSSVDTKNAGTKTVYDQLRVAGASGATTTYDDLYLLSGAGEVFRGDTVIAEGVLTKTWNGSAFVAAPVRTWNGSTFVDAVALKTWNGSAFV